MIKEALDQVISVTGDIHGGLFHLLSAYYSLFYPLLIQPVQEPLGWKRIYGYDVTKYCQQAAGLTIMMDDELKRQILIAYFNHVCEDASLLQMLQSTPNPNSFVLLIT